MRVKNSIIIFTRIFHFNSSPVPHEYIRIYPTRTSCGVNSKHWCGSLLRFCSSFEISLAWTYVRISGCLPHFPIFAPLSIHRINKSIFVADESINNDKTHILGPGSVAMGDVMETRLTRWSTDPSRYKSQLIHWLHISCFLWWHFKTRSLISERFRGSYFRHNHECIIPYA